MSIGKNIQFYRKKKGWSQSTLGNQVNIDYRKISLYELEKSIPSADVLLLLANALGVTPNDLYGIPRDDQDLLVGCTSTQEAYIRELVAFTKIQLDKYIIG